MRRLFIIRKDLHLSPGKLASQVGHCCEAYWTNLMQHSFIVDHEFAECYAFDLNDPTKPAFYLDPTMCKEAEEAFKRGEKKFLHKKTFPRKTVTIELEIPKDIWNGYVNDIYTKTICEARNKNHLLKAEAIAKELNLKENVDYGFINDKCLTELTPENDDGTTTVGMWFAPLADEVAHKISKKFPLYRDDAPTISIPRRDQKWILNWHKCGDAKTETFEARGMTPIDVVNQLLQANRGMCAGDIVIDSFRTV